MTIDKSTWRPGPWHGEPDEQRWTHHGYACAVLRIPELGNLCGYVAVPEGHPWHGQGYSDIDADVHGGLTFANATLDGESPEGLWWLGFDAAHFGDGLPRLLRVGGKYRDIGYVTDQTNKLAEQAARASSTEEPRDA